MSLDYPKINTPWGPIGYITFKRTYSRRLKEDNPNSRTEEFRDVIIREIEASDKQLKVGFTDEEKLEYFRLRSLLKFSVAGRFMWQLGTKTVDRIGLTSLQNCFSRETEFITYDGIKSFLDFESGDDVKIRGKKGWKQGKVVKFGQQELINLTLRKGRRLVTYKVTRNHRWILNNGNILLTEDLKIGDKLKSLESRLVLEELQMCPTAIQHGIVFGDGHKISNGESTAITIVGDSIEETYKFFNKTEAKMVCGLPYFYKDLPDLSKANSHYLYGFLSGWFLADGSIGENGSNITLSNKSETVLKWARGAFAKLGITTSEVNLSREISPFDGSPKPLYRISIDRENLPQDFFLLKKHKTRFKKLKNPISWKVESVDFTNSVIEDVWCIVEPEREEFSLASGVLTKNCAFVTVNSPIEPFTWAFEMLMLGSGVGYNIQKENVYQLPKLKSKLKIVRHETNDADFIVPDTREGWVKLLGKVLKAHFYSGEGFTYSTVCVRGKGTPIKGFGGLASGPEELCWGIEEIHRILNSRSNKKLRPVDCLDIMNIIGFVVVSGNVRRSAQLAIGDYDDIEFLKAKRWDLGSIPNWRSMSNNSIVPPKDLNELPDEYWETYNQGEPYGLINIDLSRKCGRVGDIRYVDTNIEGYNPCVTGDTLVAVADGRNAVPIKDLVGTEYPVYTIKNKKVTIGKSIKTWKTRENAEIWELVLDDGSKLKTTPDHLIMMRDGSYKKLQDLKAGESLMPFNSYLSNKNYRQISSNIGRDRRQYRMIAEYNNLIFDPKITAIHHKDFNSFNDCIENLQSMSHEDHKLLHSLRMLGSNNPVNRMSKEDYRKKYINFYTNNGDKNPMYGKKHSENTIKTIGEKSAENWANQKDFMSLKIKEGMKDPLIRQKISDARKRCIKLLDWSCPVCNNELKLTEKQAVKRKTCSKSCSNKSRYNHKVVSVNFIGYEDVYDMTVEETHNFGVITSHKDNKYIESSGIFIHNCAEQSLNNFETCCLAELFLPNIDSYDELLISLKYAYRMCKHSLSLKCNLKKTEEIVNKNMRMGVGITGYLQCSEEKKNWLPKAYEWLRKYDEEYSKLHGFPVSIKLTTFKPSGTLSLKAGVTPGANPNPAGPYYIRRVRLASNSPLVQTCINHGYHVEFQKNFDGSDDKNTMVVEFPCMVPEDTPIASNFSWKDQLDTIRRCQKEWSDNSVSCTVTYKKEDLPEIKEYLNKYFTDEIKTVSFLLYHDHGFIQAPYETISRKKYEEMISLVKPIDSISFINDDMEIQECESGACPVR